MITIRPYQDADYDMVARLQASEDMLEDHWDSRESFAARVAERPNAILVAEVGGEVVGSVASIAHGTEAAWLFRLVVAESHRKQGIASALLERMTEALKADGFKEVALWANSKDSSLHEFYKHRGYKTSEHAYIVMWKPL